MQKCKLCGTVAVNSETICTSLEDVIENRCEDATAMFSREVSEEQKAHDVREIIELIRPCTTGDKFSLSDCAKNIYNRFVGL